MAYCFHEFVTTVVSILVTVCTLCEPDEYPVVSSASAYWFCSEFMHWMVCLPFGSGLELDIGTRSENTWPRTCGNALVILCILIVLWGSANLEQGLVTATSFTLVAEPATELASERVRSTDTAKLFPRPRRGPIYFY